MKQLNVFVLLPEVNPLHDFFHTAYDFVEEDLLRSFLKELEDSIEWVHREKNAESFYSLENVQLFLDCFEDFKEDYLIDPASIMGEILNDANNWQQVQQQEQNCAYFIWEGQTAHRIAHHVLAEIAERQLKNRDESFVLFNFYAASFGNQQVTLLKEIHEDNRLSLLPNFTSVDKLNNLYQWLTDNRQKRNFNLNPKHGENGRDAHPSSRDNEVSPLMCSRFLAQELLDKAIGDVRKTSELYNFDTLN